MNDDNTNRTVKFPPSSVSWLSPERVDYLSKLLQVFLFALAIPYTLFRLGRNPISTLKGASVVHAAA